MEEANSTFVRILGYNATSFAKPFMFMGFMTPLAIMHVTTAANIYKHQRTLFNTTVDNAFYATQVQSVYEQYRQFINANWQPWYLWRIGQITASKFNDVGGWTINDSVTGYSVGGRDCDQNFRDDTVQQLRAEATAMGARTIVPFVFLNRVVPALRHLPYVLVAPFSGSPVVSLGSYTSWSSQNRGEYFIGDSVGDGGPAFQWDQPGIIRSIAGGTNQWGQYLRGPQFQYATHAGLIVDRTSGQGAVFNWTVPASRYIAWLVASWGGTSPGIVTNMRVGYNDSTSEAWPPINANDEWGGIVGNWSVGPGWQLVGFGQAGRSGPQGGSVGVGALGTLWVPASFVAAGIFPGAGAVAPFSQPCAPAYAPCVANHLGGGGCCDASHLCIRHASACGGSAATVHLCVPVSYNDTLRFLRRVASE